jgi:hypothetical protein
MRIEETYGDWNQGRLTQGEAELVLGMSERNFRRYVSRYEAEGEAGLEDKRGRACLERGAPLTEVMAVQERYRERHAGWNVRHFHSWYRREGGERSDSWVKKHLQAGGLVKRGSQKGKHRRKRDRKPLIGMMIHQDGSRHEWLTGQWHDLIVTMDDATGEHYAMFLVAEEGTASSFRGMEEVIGAQGLPCSFYSDRGSPYWHTPVADRPVDKSRLTQFGRAMKSLGITMIAAYSPQARGRSERVFRTRQDRLVKELALRGMADIEAANRYLQQTYLPRYNAEFAVPAREEGSAFVPWIGGETLREILCEHYERTVGADNCVRFERLSLPIPADRHRRHYVKAKVSVHRYSEGALSIFHGPRKLADYDPEGREVRIVPKPQAAHA